MNTPPLDETQSDQPELEAEHAAELGADEGPAVIDDALESAASAPADAARDAGEDDVEDDDSDDDEPRDEGDIAGDYLEELLDIADIDGDLDIEDRDGRILISITAEGEGASSLSKLGGPETVDALQQLARLAVQAETGELSRLILDIAGSRDARKTELARLVATAIERLDGGASSAALPPMSSYERKIVHDLAAEQGCVSESEGEGRDRHPVLRRA